MENDIDLRKEIKCISCNKIMKKGNTIVGDFVQQYRYCTCGISYIIYENNPKYRFGLHYELRENN